MTQGNIPAEKLKVNDVLYFESNISQSFMIITSIQNNIINFIGTKLNLKSREMNIYKNSVDHYKWNNKDLAGQKYEYCKNPRTAIIDLFSCKVKFYEF